LAAPTAFSETFELQLLRWSPLGTIATTVLIGVVVYGLFWLNVWVVEDIGELVAEPGGQNISRVALVLRLILCAVICIAKYDETTTARDNEILKREFGIELPSRRYGSPGLRWAALVGFIAGLVNLWFLVSINTQGDVLAFAQTIGLWFVPMTPLLSMLLARGVFASVKSGRAFSKLIKQDLAIDLYRHHQLVIFGRIAMRSAFVWLIIVGIILISLSHQGTQLLAQPTLLIAIAAAMFSFISTMQPIRKKIRAAKEAELATVRERLAAARTEMEKGGAGADVPALIAIEHRIEGIRDWPLDLPTAARLPLYILIPIATWGVGVYAETLLHNLFGGA
jgi:hypothetical protein